MQQQLTFDRSGTTLLVAAHPDDEVIGAGSRLAQLGKLTIAHVTDGAPRNLIDARNGGFDSWQEYARERHREMLAALSVAEIHAETIGLGIPDQETALRLPETIERLAALIRETAPDRVLTHPYEGGHPDHDACAFAVHAAAGRVPVYEFTSYHARAGGIEAGEFLDAGDEVVTVRLTPAEQERKRAMLDCFRTQRQTLAMFDVLVERYRPAPRYDFSRPPHAGQLLYERYDWGMTAARFTELARAALREVAA